MKWAKLDGIAPDGYLLYKILMWVIAPHSNRPVDHFLKRILGSENGFGGDPGWEIEHLEDAVVGNGFRVWADKEISCLDEEERIYDSETFYKAVRETLEAYSIAHPSHRQEIAEIIRHYGFDLIQA